MSGDGLRATRPAALQLVLGLLLAVAPAAVAAEVDARVSSIRPERVYIQVRQPVAVAAGAEVRLGPKGGEPVLVRVQAASSKFLAIDPPTGLTLTPGQRLVVWAELVGEPTAPPPAAAAEGGQAPVQIGRAQPTRRDYFAQPVPEFEKVPFRNRVGPDRPAEEPGAKGAGPRAGQGGAGTGPAGPITTPDEDVSGLTANEVRGEVELGVDGAFDDDAGIDRYTPFTRLRFEVRNLGGSDRARLFFYGSLRQPIDGTDDWTGHDEDQLVARISAAVLELEARPEGQVESFTDRIELRLGRSTVPGVVQAGVVDGAQVGIRAGPAVLFGFFGAPASPDPQRVDYDGTIYGGGIRVAKSFPHAGAFRFSLAAAQERFRGEGARDFIEARTDIRYGIFGVRGALVLDLYSALLDRKNTRMTTGMLSVYAQVTPDVRIEAGYREVRPQYPLSLVEDDRLARGSSDLDPLVLPRLQRHERRTFWTSLNLRLPHRMDLLVRGEYLTGQETRDVAGLVLGLGKSDIFARDRIRVDLSVRRRMSADGVEASTTPFVTLGYSWFGDIVVVDTAIYYRTSIPSTQFDDSRIGARLSLDAQLENGFGFRTYVGAELYRDTEDPGELFTGGLSVRYRF